MYEMFLVHNVILRIIIVFLIFPQLGKMAEGTDTSPVPIEDVSLE